MKYKEHLLAIAAEEATEVAHAISKALRFGLDNIGPNTVMTNAEKIADELSDLEGALQELRSECPEVPQIDEAKVTAKRMRINDFLEVSARQGTLEE